MSSRIRPAAVALVAAASLAALPAAAAAATPAQRDAAVAAGAAWIRGQQAPDGSLPGFNGDWAVTSLAAAGVHAADVRTAPGAPSLQDRVHADTAGDDFRLATLAPWTVAGTIGKAALIAEAAGIRPARVAPGVNLAATLATRWDAAAGSFDPPSVNSDGFALLAGDALDLPRGVRERVVALVRASQHDDGGWAFFAGGNLAAPGDVDMTGAALAMLCGEGATPADPAVADGLAFLAGRRDAATGAILAGPFVPALNAPSSAWALIGLNACRVADAATPSIGDFLLSLQRPDGSFRYVPTAGATAPQDMNATEAAVRALAGAAFAVPPPERTPRRRAVEPVADGTPVPLALGVDDRAGDVRYCAVTVPSGAALGALVDAAIATGCLPGPLPAPAAGAAWVASLAGGPFRPVAGRRAGAGDNVALELRTWPLAASAWSVELGEQPAGTLGPVSTVTLSASAEGVRPARSAAGGDFVVVDDTCAAAMLDAGDACSVGVRFAPSASGGRTATLLVTDDRGDALSAVELHGTGTAPAGATATPGPQGAPGPPGAVGPRGRRGRDARVTCRLVRRGGMRRVRCVVRLAARHRGGARLVRGGRTYARGPVGALRPTRAITAGTYTLRVGTRALRATVR